MPESLTPTQVALAERVTAFARDELEPRRSWPAVEARDEVVAAARRAGLFPMTQPVEHGGTAAGAVELTIVREALAAEDAPHAGFVLGPGPGVLANATGVLARECLDPLMAGTKRAAFGFTERDSSAPTVADPRGDHYQVHGTKSYVTGGRDADFVNTLARIDGAPALFAIDTTLPGVVIEEVFHSLDGSHHAVIRFDAVRVPSTRLIGQPGEGLPRALGQIGDTRLAIAAQCVGTMRFVLRLLRSHLTQVDRSGKPRGNRENVRLRYGALRVKAYAARSVLYRSARITDGPDNHVNECIAAKVFATEAVSDIVDGAMQLIGGSALAVGHPLERLYRTVRSLRMTEGLTDVLLMNVSRGDLDLNKGRL